MVFQYVSFVSIAANKPTGFYEVSAGRWNPIYDTHLSFCWSLWSSAERWDGWCSKMGSPNNLIFEYHSWDCWPMQSHLWLWDKRGKIQLSLARDSLRKFQIVTTQEAYHVKQNQYKPPKSEITTHQLKTNATESSTLTDTDQKFNRSNYQTSNMITKPI